MRQRITHYCTRREFLGRSAIFGLTASFPLGLQPPTLAQNRMKALASPSPVVVNHAPLMPRAYDLLPLGSIRPRGWLKRQLRIQANGLSGHLGQTWPDVGPDSGWLGGTGEAWERGPYYLDGIVALAWTLDDPALKKTAQPFIDWTLEHQTPDGRIGPSSNDDWWPRIVMLKALTQYQEATGDPRVIPAMDRYLRFQLAELPRRPLCDWARFRWQDEVLSVIWLYNRTGSTYLLRLANLLHDQGYDWVKQSTPFPYTRGVTAEFLRLNSNQGLSDQDLATHGVNNGQAIKTGPVWSLLSGSAADRGSALRMIADLDRFHGLPNGMFSCDEHLAGRNPSHGSELCTVVESMFSLEQSLSITGQAVLGDWLERLAFNALPGTFTDDMWAHQYDQEPNQVECSLHRKPWVSDGPESNLYGLSPNFGCCTANFSQGWPKFAASLWMRSPAQAPSHQEGLVAAAYAPCEVNIMLGGRSVRLLEVTDYPFRGSVRLDVHPEAPLSFPLRLRIPGWASGTSLTVNGHSLPSPQPGTFAFIERTWAPGDTVQISFPLLPRTSRWYHHSVALERGPLVFSYGIGEDWVKLRNRGLTADWQVFPTTPWNYALRLDPDAPESSIQVSESEVGEVPFSRDQASVRMVVRARQLDLWQAEDGAADPLPSSPVASSNREASLTLIPYAAAKLRMTAFPLCED